MTLPLIFLLLFNSQLNGYKNQTKLQIYIGDESARVKPHGFYQACRVFGKNSTPCTEQEIEGTAVIEIDLTPENDMTAKLVFYMFL